MKAPCIAHTTDELKRDCCISSPKSQVVRRCLIGGVGALRTHGGDAHGREKGYARVDARIARLAIHAASTAALFLIETWRRKFPARPLPKADDPEM